MSNVKCRSGFTLIELLVSVGVVVVLVALGIPSLRTYQERAELTAAAERLGQTILQAQVLAQAPAREKAAGATAYGVQFDAPAGRSTLAAFAGNEGAFTLVTTLQSTTLPPGLKFLEVRDVFFPVGRQSELAGGKEVVIRIGVARAELGSRVLRVNPITGLVEYEAAP